MSSTTLITVFYVLIIIFQLQTSKAKQIICKTLSCGDIDIAFPFILKEANQNQDPLCSYFPNPTFQLSCNNQSQTILNLPKTQNLIIKNINYKTQTIQVTDPKGCLPKRYLDNNFNLSGSPFKLNPEIYNTNGDNLTFIRCPSNVTTYSSTQFPLTPISCLSNEEERSNFSSSSVIVSWVPTELVETTLSHMCEVISTALVPLPWMDMTMWPSWPDLNSDVELVWNEPRCGNCAVHDQVCGFSEDHQVQCFPNTSNQGLLQSAKFGIAFGLGIPALLLIAIACFCNNRRTTQLDGQRNSSNVPTITISLEPLPSFVTGLDGATIEKYPKTLFGESGRLLKPNDNTCSICLSEYQLKETLRSIPECNHYFHATCIDEWLKMNGTCPICRNSPEVHASTGPYFASLLLSPNSSSLSSTR
ncbi:putative RING-H2 finger protein ATL21A [Trifolium repens]|nr:putative RING-H2 finger protein ATL21A [Trifolium repens]